MHSFMRVMLVLIVMISLVSAAPVQSSDDQMIGVYIYLFDNQDNLLYSLEGTLDGMGAIAYHEEADESTDMQIREYARQLIERRLLNA